MFATCSVGKIIHSPDGRQMAIEKSVSNDFLSTFVDSIDVFDCHLPGVMLAVPAGQKLLVSGFIYILTLRMGAADSSIVYTCTYHRAGCIHYRSFYSENMKRYHWPSFALKDRILYSVIKCAG